MSNRGYSGFYKDNYLRSSYEYVFARILDFDNKQWTYEEKVFSLGDRYYKPDFFLYKNEQLERIIEVKSEVKTENLKARSNLSVLEKNMASKVNLLTTSIYPRCAENMVLKSLA